jgi:hypothetical protein
MVAAMILIILAPVASLYAHGVTWDYSDKKSYGLRFTYDDDTAMKFSEVKVYGPNDKAKLSQVGRTNETGYFAFVPGEDGEWTITSDDNNGHLATADLTIKTEETPAAGGGEPAAEAAPMVNMEKALGQATKPLKIGLVVSVFLNLALAFKAFGGKKGAAGQAKT